MAATIKDMTNPRLLEFSSTDGLTLPGLLFEPAISTKNVALYLHGNGNASVFYAVDNTNTMAMALSKANIAYFAFNNRGAHVMQKLNRTLPDNTLERGAYGTAFEIIKDCVYDIDGAIAFLKGLGYKRFFLIGESTGANKICVYNHYKPKNDFSKYVLVSAGDDSGIYYQELGKATFNKAIATAKIKVAEDNGLSIVAKDISNVMGYMSYQSTLDMLDPDGDYNTFPFNEALNNLHLSSKPLFGYYAEIVKPTLVVQGGQDEYCYGNVPGVIELLKTHKNREAEFEFKIIPEADHGLVGKYGEFAHTTAAFLSK